MHIFQTDGKGHGPRKSVPEGLLDEPPQEVGETAKNIDYPESVSLGDEMRLDTYTGQVFKGKRGMMIHLGQKAGQDNIPKNVTNMHDGDDFPIVEVDDDGNITKLLREGRGSVPPANPRLPSDIKDTEEYVRASEIEKFVEEVREGTGAATADHIEWRLLKEKMRK
jgi:hypothetical protein